MLLSGFLGAPGNESPGPKSSHSFSLHRRFGFLVSVQSGLRALTPAWLGASRDEQMTEGGRPKDTQGLRQLAEQSTWKLHFDISKILLETGIWKNKRYFIPGTKRSANDWLLCNVLTRVSGP